MPRLSLLLALALTVPVAAGAKTLEVGPEKAYKQPSAAIAAAAEGDKVLIDAGEYFDCATVSASNVTIEGAGKDGSAVLTDKACGGKALLITTGNNITIRNLTLTRARVPDGNGAGIRGEGNGLVVDHVKFINNQNGILANSGPDGSVIVRDSEFVRNGACNNACAHAIYVGPMKLLQVLNTRFTDTRQGHHIKSRALRTEVIGCTIIDGPTGTASYLIDVPNGGSVIVRNNTMEKGPKAENHSTAIMIGAEGVTQPTREIKIENNSFRNAGTYNTFLVINHTATDAMLKGNKLSGKIEPLHGDGEVQ
jgi:pectate lyase